MIKFEQQREKRLTIEEHNLSNLEYSKTSNRHAIGGPGGEETEDIAEKVLEEIMVEYFPNLAKGINL